MAIGSSCLWRWSKDFSRKRIERWAQGSGLRSTGPRQQIDSGAKTLICCLSLISALETERLQRTTILDPLASFPIFLGGNMQEHSPGPPDMAIPHLPASSLSPRLPHWSLWNKICHQDTRDTPWQSKISTQRKRDMRKRLIAAATLIQKKKKILSCCLLRWVLRGDRETHVYTVELHSVFAILFGQSGYYFMFFPTAATLYHPWQSLSINIRRR